MGYIATRLHLFSASSIAGIQAQVLRVFLIWYWTQHHNMVQGIFQPFDIMGICSRKNHCQRKSVFIGQYTTFCPHFFPDPLDFFQRIPVPVVLSPYSRPDSALPADPLQLVILFQTFGPYSFKKTRCFPFLKISMDTAACSVFFRYCFPLATRSQYIEYAL